MRANLFWPLCLSLLALTYATQAYFMALLAWGALWTWLRNREPWRLRKIWLYVGVLPFALWWVVAPRGENWHGVPLLLFYIPGWFFWWLAWAQGMTLGKGGERAFVRWNAAAALLTAGMVPSIPFYVVAAGFVLQWGRDLRQDRSAHGRAMVAWLSTLALVVVMVAGANFMRTRVRAAAGDAYAARQEVGFGSVSFLGSFADEYGGARAAEAGVRLFGKQVPYYLRGAVYGRYRIGTWSAPTVKHWLRPKGQKVEYSLFGKYEPSDFITRDEPIWVLPVADHHGVLLVPPATLLVGAIADSVSQGLGGDWSVDESNAGRGWFAWWDSTGAALELTVDSQWLQWPVRLDSILSLTRQSAGCNSGNTQQCVQGLQHWFAADFRYTLTPPAPGRREPLNVFLESREGYCEYFATLAVLALRHAGVPARYVTGYADPDPVAKGQWVYARGHAHAWVEYYANGLWHTFDPTPGGRVGAGTPVANWQRWVAAWQGRVAWWMHVLRDGDWKLWLDKWQTRIESWLDAPWFWLILILPLSLGGLFWRLRKRSTMHRVSYSGAGAWSEPLQRCEIRLQRLGFGRDGGETVGHWLMRLNRELETGELTERQKKLLVAEMPFLLRYQNERFRAP